MLRNAFAVACLSILLLVPTAARATSFANRGLGLGVGFMRIFADDATVPEWAVPIWLEGSYYAESGFEVYLRIPLAPASVKIGVPPSGGPGIVFATGGQFGVRYLFLEETVRPFVFLHLSGIYVIRPTTNDIQVGSNLLVGPGTGGGLEIFVSDSISLQARGFLDWFIGVNCGQNNCQRFGVGGSLTASTYF